MTPLKANPVGPGPSRPDSPILPPAPGRVPRHRAGPIPASVTAPLGASRATAAGEPSGHPEPPRGLLFSFLIAGGIRPQPLSHLRDAADRTGRTPGLRLPLGYLISLTERCPL